MPKYVVFWNAGICGTDSNSGVVEFDCEEDAVDAYYEEAFHWTEGMQSLHGGHDEGEEIDVDRYMELWAEEYDPEKHDGQL